MLILARSILDKNFNLKFSKKQSLLHLILNSEVTQAYRLARLTNGVLQFLISHSQTNFNLSNKHLCIATLNLQARPTAVKIF